MAKICVGSVFADTTKRNQEWLDLQLHFLTKTTFNFDHHVVVMDSDPKGLERFQSKTTVLPFSRQAVEVAKGDWPPAESHYHKQGFDCLLKHFQRKQDQYSGFLFLDSDAFPIRKGWAEKLLDVMRRIGKKKIATTLRFEHTERRLHACVLFCHPSVIGKVKVEAKELPGGDLIGKMERDLILEPYQEQERDQALVLLNSNQYKVHPLLCMIYYDMFYHHGCGSRPIGLRAIKGYWQHVMDQDLAAADNLFNELKQDPTGFISKLAGWNKTRYV